MRYKIGDTTIIKNTQPTSKLIKGDVVQIVQLFLTCGLYAITPLDNLHATWYVFDNELE